MGETKGCGLVNCGFCVTLRRRCFFWRALRKKGEMKMRACASSRASGAPPHSLSALFRPPESRSKTQLCPREKEKEREHESAENLDARMRSRDKGPCAQSHGSLRPGGVSGEKIYWLQRDSLHLIWNASRVLDWHCNYLRYALKEFFPSGDLVSSEIFK